MADQLRAGQHERQPQHDRPQNAPEQHPVLVLHGHLEEAEDDGEDEDVVHRQRPFDHVAGQEGHARLAAEPPPDQAVEGGGQAAPEDGPAGRFAQRWRAVVPMEHQQVQPEQDGHQDSESDPMP